MGMDFRIYRHVYVGSEYARRKVTGELNLTVLGIKLNINVSKLASVTELLYHGHKTYWLKEWFQVEQRDYIDNGMEVLVSYTLLNKLRDSCRFVIDHKRAPEIVNICLEKLHFPLMTNEEHRADLFSELDRIVDGLAELKESAEDSYGVLADW